MGEIFSKIFRKFKKIRSRLEDFYNFLMFIILRIIPTYLHSLKIFNLNLFIRVINIYYTKKLPCISKIKYFLPTSMSYYIFTYLHVTFYFFNNSTIRIC